ncbi:hypothetical protein [Azospirillum canadense]|uniref:hypothetical protein n=1 Tax=Azospirillum canadense TaxID=403962 RepID=UPI002225FDF9|nr:hypothetical protein [Azospirillum canadense]MCW2242047.1 hypothetical protein [Azospirillum canadense]MCW2242431.1 hypothetical protein [Azospirillum canadense]
MNIRTIAASAVLSSALLTSTAGIAAAANGASGTPESFATQLSDAKTALVERNTGTIGREERNEASKYLTMAASLWDQGDAAKAQQFLTFGRGFLGLKTAPTAVTVARRVDGQTPTVR